MNNRLGRLFTVTSFGESHGRCVGVVINGCPAGLPLNEDDIQREVD
ncbi:MAG: chorismate synthase, partial [Dehalococcoidales bacterium]|nr:chorismate synthase [Dehalococcoidales bacterium]